ncbi:polyphenol oxidase family protein [Lichenihabitans psoromatis]|uniref:polyphenol oxidase family protein n=1 Tax=Lichenihabitans psoromatis TaxID=2528642 RepID=UPI0010384556|nr:polyphenol oxidase family protein [Lichenihabitans psoromatis]
MTLSPIQADALSLPGIRHAFFTREGGVSTGVYTGLNGGVGSRDAPEAVKENRARMALYLGVAPDDLVVPFQIHSADVLLIDAPFASNDRPRVDGLVTRTAGLAIGVTGADCGIVLMADAEAGVVGAVHSGWKGALTGALEATIETMVQAGARRDAITAVLGPTIGQASYEVGPEFVDRFVSTERTNARFFTPSPRQDHALFDLPAFIGARLTGAGIGRFVGLGLDTYPDERRFYSYRRATHRGEPDYGRLVAAIALAG